MTTNPYVECIEACVDVLMQSFDATLLRDTEMRLATLCALIQERRTYLEDMEDDPFREEHGRGIDGDKDAEGTNREF